MMAWPSPLSYKTEKTRDLHTVSVCGTGMTLTVQNHGTVICFFSFKPSGPPSRLQNPGGFERNCPYVPKVFGWMRPLETWEEVELHRPKAGFLRSGFDVNLMCSAFVLNILVRHQLSKAMSDLLVLQNNSTFLENSARPFERCSSIN